MRLPDQHLSADEIESLGKEEELSGELREQLRPAREHAESCPACRRRLEVYPTSGAKLERLRATQRIQKGPDCPSIDIWLKLAGGLLNTAEQKRYTIHAAQCDYCGPVLREVVQDFLEPVTEKERAVFAGLKIPNRQRRQPVPDRIALPPSIPSHRWLGVPRWQLAVAVLVICIGIGFLVFRFLAPREVNTLASLDRLLAQAYTEHRTIELRFPGASYGQWTGERGVSQSHGKLPASLLEAEAAIARGAIRHLNDPRWLQVEARAALLEWDYEEAIKKLNRALEVKPADPSLLSDAALAHFEKAEKEDSGTEYGTALQLLSEVLRKRPADPTALFDRAILYEKESLWEKAAEDWQNYLRSEPADAWAKEALERSRKAQDHLRRRGSTESITRDPVTFLASFSLNNEDAESHIEDYQDLAIRDWLLQASALTQPVANRRQATKALDFLARLLAARHGDYWLSDLVRHSASAVFHSAVRDLVEAISEAASGDLNGRAYPAAGRAADEFLSIGNLAGVLRARVEQVHALRRSQQGHRCLERSRGLDAQLSKLRYRWAQIQVAIDECSCSLMIGSFDLARSYVLKTAKDAQQSGYRNLYLRSVGLEASVDTDEGDLDAAWQQNHKGLAEYWRAPSPPIRAQQFYDDLSYSAATLQQWDLALAFAQASAQMASLMQDPIIEALAHQHASEIANQGGRLEIASEELRKSRRLLTSLSSTDAVKRYRMYSEIGLASIDLQKEQLAAAEQRLFAIKKNVDKLVEVGNLDQLKRLRALDSFTIPRIFYKTYGDLLVKQGRPRDAENAFHRGIEIADSGLSTISDSSSRYFWTQENAGLYRSLVSLEMRVGDDKRALGAWEWYRAASLRRKGIAAQSLDAFWRSAEINHLLTRFVDQTVLSYALMPEGLVVWVFDDRGVRSTLVRLDSEGLIRSAAEFTEMCSDKNSDLGEIQAAGRKLFDLLISPVLGEINPSRTLVIEADDLIADLPFGALLGRDGHYLGETYRVVSSFGLLYQQVLRSSSRFSPADHALIIGSTANTTEELSLEPAPDVLNEANEVAKRFIKPQLLEGSDATAEKMESFLPQAHIVHYVGHAVSSPKMEGLLVFASSTSGKKSSVLWGANRVAPKLFAQSKLVVLSACGTGKSYRGRKKINGELMRSIFASGVPDIVASRWNVDSSATKEYMDAFYSNLLAGRSASSAVQQAETEMRTRPDRRHPCYWAAFTIFGRG